jgi:heparanase 1
MNVTSPNSSLLRLPWMAWLRRLWPVARSDKPPRVLEAWVTLEDPEPVAQVDERYLSFSLDISVVAGGFWWEGAITSRSGLGMLRIPPLDLNSPKLDKFTQALTPAYLRVGGSEADRVHYFSAPSEELNSLVLTQAIWDRLHGFLQRNQLRFFFTVKYGLFERRQHGQWQGGEVEKLLQYSREKGYRIDVCELGNELNAYWAFHGLRSQPRAFKLAVDYHNFSQIIQRHLPQARIIGPGSAFWPKLGETIKPFSNITKKFLETCQQHQTPLHIVDWHYYPFQSLRSPIRTRTATPTAMLKPRALNDFQKYSVQLRAWRDQFYPQAELWTGETGSAQCGGQPKLSDRFISCFWWADQLGQGGLNDQKVMIRQCLIGGEYGLIDRLTLKPRPDYWLSWLWKRLMGTRVFAVSSPHHMLRCYCHGTPSTCDNIAGGDKTLLIINLSARPFHLHPAGFGQLVRQYALTAKKLTSKKVRINGKKARYAGGSFRLEDYASTELTHEIPGHSIHFWLYHSAAAE